ncbi:MAG: glycosyltransferase [Dehalococcoidia bacterium]|nr:glycosyltransferase [Dehalococcoidia bacterium]
MTTQLSFVIPVYNRRNNLYLVLHGLVYQTCRDFEVIVCDDGSTDSPLDILEGFNKYFPVKYYRHARGGYRVCLARNQGVRLSRQDTTHIWFLDSDVVLNPHAVENAIQILEERPETVIAGRYNWLRARETTPALIRDWAAFKDVYTRDDGRTAPWDDEREVPCSGAARSGNLIISMRAFHLTGGFDEDLEGVGGEDCEFGYNMLDKGLMMVMSESIGGLHMDHSPTYDNYTRTKGVRQTIRYIHRKYDIPLREDQLPALPPKPEGVKE